MNPVPRLFLSLQLLAMCGLCGWQWHREHQLRDLAAQQKTEIDTLQTERAEAEARLKTADAEILRLTGALAELRANSVSAQEHQDLLAELGRLKEAVAKQNEALQQQAQAMIQANASILAANETVRKVTAERDGLVSKLNEVTAQYNELATKGR